MTTAPPVIELGGSPYERGRSHGRLLRERIRERVARLLERRGLDRVPHRLAGPFVAELERGAPHLLDEVRGIAAGAGVAFEQALVLSAFEVLDHAGTPARASAGCTAVGIASPRSVVVAQNWDGRPDDADGIVVLSIEPPDGGHQVVLASAGGLGWAGMNSAGVGVVNTDLLLAHSRPCLPSVALRRLLLEQRTVAACLDLLATMSFPAGRSYILGDRSETLSAVEVSADSGCRVLRQDRRRVAHANHVEHPDLRENEDRDGVARIYPSSAHRARRARQLLGAHGEDGTTKVTRLLADHDGFPLSICKHASDEEPSQTIATAVFDLRERRATFTVGHPCTSQPVVVEVRGGR